MGTKKYKPNTPGQRSRQINDYADLTTSKKEKSLLKSFAKKSGRNNSGKITVRHRGGGNKRFYREIDFSRKKFDVDGKVVSIEYDPNRSAFISLIHYVDGEKRYIITPNKIKVGSIIKSSENSEIKPGNTLPIQLIPLGTMIHNIEMHKGKGAQLVRSAGVYATVTGMHSLKELDENLYSYYESKVIKEEQIKVIEEIYHNNTFFIKGIKSKGPQ